MKKTLVALAALASMSAFAQSSVTLYGVAEATADIGYKKTVDTRADTFNAAGVVTAGQTANATTKGAFRIQDGNDQGVGTSRLGWRGTEDLGGGLKANFQMEMGLRLDDGCLTTGAGNVCSSGNTGGNVFGRNAWVGASGGFGETRLGRQVLGSFGVQANSWAPGSSSQLYDPAATLTPSMGGVRFSNAIKYLTPNFGGFSGSIALSAPEGSGSTNNGVAGVGNVQTSTSNKTGIDLAAEYANGPLYAGLGYNKTKTSTSSVTQIVGGQTVVASSNAVKGLTFGASYDFGVARPFFNYTKTNGDVVGTTSTLNLLTGISPTAVDKTWSLGVRAPFGPVTMIASYAKGKTDTTGTGITANAVSSLVANNADKKGFQLGAQYALSKRTMLEANYGQIKIDGVNRTTNIAAGASTGGTIANSNSKESALNIGVRHAF